MYKKIKSYFGGKIMHVRLHSFSLHYKENTSIYELSEMMVFMSKDMYCNEISAITFPSFMNSSNTDRCFQEFV